MSEFSRTHRFVDEHGETVGFKSKKSDGSGWLLQRADESFGSFKPVPYRLDSLSQALRQYRETGDLNLHICESEKDADTLHGDRGWVATSNCGGGSDKKSIDQLVDLVVEAHRDRPDGSPEICIHEHNDDVGRAFSGRVFRKLRLAGVDSRVLRPALRDGGADITDHLESGLTLEECEDVTSDRVLPGIGYKARSGESRREPREPDWLVRDLIECGSVVFLGGQRSSKKSFLALDLAMHLSSGAERWNGKKIHRRACPVVYFVGEGVESAWDRREHAFWHDRDDGLEVLKPASDRNLISVFGLPNIVGDEAQHEAAKRFVEEVGAEVVIIDTYSKLLGKAGVGENDNTDVAYAEERVRDLGCRDRNVTALIVDHEGKVSKGSLRGGSSKEGGADAIFMAEARPDGEVHVHTAKMREGSDDQVLLFGTRYVPLGDYSDGDGTYGSLQMVHRGVTTRSEVPPSADQGGAPMNARAAVLEALRGTDDNDEAKTRHEIAEEKNLNAESLKRTIRDLKDEGKIEVARRRGNREFLRLTQHRVLDY